MAARALRVRDSANDELRQRIASIQQEQHVAPGELGGRFAGREPGREAGDRGDLRMTGGAQRGPSAHRMTDEDDGQLAMDVQQLVEGPFGVAHRIGVGRVPAAVAVPEQGDGGVRRSCVHRPREWTHPHVGQAMRGDGPVADFASAVQHEHDAVEVLAAAVRDPALVGTFNVAGDGVLLLSQAARRLGRPTVPVAAPLTPWLGMVLRAAGVDGISGEQFRALVHGRVVATARLRVALGGPLEYSTADAFADFAAAHGPGLLAPERVERVLDRMEGALRHG